MLAHQDDLPAVERRVQRLLPDLHGSRGGADAGAHVPERFADRTVLNKPLALDPLREALIEIGTVGA